MRISKDGPDAAEARDEMLNPAKRKTPSTDAPFDTAATRQFIHFGAFANAEAENAVISFWKNWYQQYQSQP